MSARFVVFFIVWGCLAGGAAQAANPRPNIVFILADDYGLDGVGCYGSDRFKNKTPHLDALAAGGLKFERCYSTPLCGPTRALLMTGRYGFRTGGATNQSAGQASYKNEPAMAKALQQAGYATGMAGKWRQMSDSPGEWGFDEYITDPTASGWFWEKSYTKNGQQVKQESEFYYPDVQQAFALDFFQRHKEKPFFFYYSMHLVHGPILRTPDTKPGTDAEQPKKGPGKGPLYDDNVAYMDKQVGGIVAELDRLGLRERTLIVFSADNGTAGMSSTLGGRQINGAKGSMWEGGSRVALIANWKGTTHAGSVKTDLVDFSDLFPTFVDVAGGTMPTGVKFDGRSFAPQVRGEKGDPRSWIFVQLGAKWYAREDGWKLNEAGELLDMKDAPFVEQPVSVDGQSEAAAAARKRLQSVLAELNPAAGKGVAPGAAPNKAAKKARKAKQAARKKAIPPAK